MNWILNQCRRGLYCGVVLLGLWHGTGKASAEPARAFYNSPAWQLLTTEREKLKEHFPNYQTSLCYYTGTHPDGSTSILVCFRSGGISPVLFRVARDGTLLWSNYAPLMRPSSYGWQARLAVRENTALVVWNETEPRGVQARLFDTEGKVLWTRELIPLPWNPKPEERESASHLNCISWGPYGWVISYDSSRASVVQRLSPDGEFVWKETPVLPRTDRPNVAASLIQDSPDSVLILWGGYGWAGEDTFEAQRVDTRGHFLWEEAVNVGPAPALSMMIPREIELLPMEQGKIKARLYKGRASDVSIRLTDYDVAISPDGKVEPLLPERPWTEEMIWGPTRR